MNNSVAGDHDVIFITEAYPTEDDPVFTFVRQLVCAIADTGVKCAVVAPQSIVKALFRGKKLRPYHWIDKTTAGNGAEIYQPKYLSFSNIRLFGYLLSDLFAMLSIVPVVNKLINKNTILYGHFWHRGIIAAKIGKKKKLPVFIACGEAKITIRDSFPKNFIEKHIDAITGVICVSTKNLNESIESGLASAEDCIVVPNAIDSNIFYIEDKLKQRERLGFDKDDFIVAFTGYFIERKGVFRLSKAIDMVGGIKSIFIGEGNQRPDCDGILFCGKLPHKEIVHYLSSADVFVLPTLAEGCCNAIIEAMACGLPIISSNLSFNDDILNNACSIRVNPNDCNAIANAIIKLKDDTVLRSSMSKAAYERSKELEIMNRATRILRFIEEKTQL